MHGNTVEYSKCLFSGSSGVIWIWQNSLVAVGMSKTGFRKSFVDRDVRFLVLAVSCWNRSCHSPAGTDSQHSNKKLLMSCLWRSALPGIAPSVITNQRPEYKLTGRMEVNSPQESWTRVISGHRQSTFSPKAAGSRHDLMILIQSWISDHCPLIRQYQRVSTLHEWKLMRLHNGGTQGSDPPHARRLLLSSSLFFRISKVKNQSHYAEEKNSMLQANNLLALWRWLHEVND